MPESTKNEVLIEWPIGRETSAFLDRYIREFRPLLQHAGGDWLFPARNGADMGRRKGGLAVAMKHEIHRAIGVAMNVHLFRTFAGALILEDNPHAVEDLRLVLGHKGLEMALMYYARFNQGAAAKRLDAIVTGKRKETRLLAQAAFRRSGGFRQGGR